MLVSQNNHNSEQDFLHLNIQHLNLQWDIGIAIDLEQSHRGKTARTQGPQNKSNGSSCSDRRTGFILLSTAFLLQLGSPFHFQKLQQVEPL